MGSEYLLKPPPGMSVSFARQRVGLGLRFEEPRQRGFGVFPNDQAFFFWAALHGFALRFWLFWHLALEYKECPGRGSDPDDLGWSPACKAGLSTSSSTGANVAGGSG